ncbi:MAG: hypothetical protein VKK99_05285 [Cyanobacteriota bacterium]|nr:hypothetical protein [Cyanobacteriota bacterium]
MAKERISSRQVADSIQWIAYALMLVFLVQVIAALFPVALLQPEWMLRFSAAIRGTASLPLLGVGLLMLANLIDGDVQPASNQLPKIRQIATLAALGFLLLIPLQSYGTVRAINGQVEERQAELKKVVSAVGQLQNATTELELRRALLAIPGGEQLARRPLGADVPTVKNFLLERIKATISRLENDLKESKSNALQRIILPLFRDGFLSLAYSLGFAAIGYNKPGQSTPLRRLLRPRSVELLRENKTYAEGLFKKQDRPPS